MTTSAAITPVPATASPAVVLRRAADYIDAHGWSQGSYLPDLPTAGPPPVCALGAIRIVICGHLTRRYLDGYTPDQTRRILTTERAFAAHLGHDFTPDDTIDIRKAIWTWNDRDWRTATEVITELRVAAGTYDRKCGCEHTDHFDDEFGPQVAHDYQGVAAGRKAHLDVGPICDPCANTCLAVYPLQESGGAVR